MRPARVDGNGVEVVEGGACEDAESGHPFCGFLGG